MRKVLQRVVDRYGVYIHYLMTLAEDKSLQSADRAQLKGYVSSQVKALYIRSLLAVPHMWMR